MFWILLCVSFSCSVLSEIFGSEGKFLFEHAVMLKTSGGRGVKKWSCARPVSPKISLGFCSVSPLTGFLFSEWGPDLLFSTAGELFH